MKAAEIYTHTHTHTHGCLCKIILSIIAIAITIPTYAKDSNNHIQPSPTNDCIESTLGTATGPANLEADWTANTINLEWYNEDTKLTVPTTSNTCTYDGGITLPSTNPTKTGYTFRGWQVRVAQQCLPSDFNYNNITYESPIGYTHLNGTAGSNESTYGLTVGSGEWAADYGNAGVIKGMAKCSAKSGNHNDYTYNNASSEWSASESELTSASGEAKYCWCQITGYDADKDKNYCPVASSSWVLNFGSGSASDCARNCAGSCTDSVRYSSSFPAALFGQVM